MGNSRFILLSIYCLVFIWSCAALNTELVISNALVAPDGYSKEAIVVNDLYPGPPLMANKGERFQVNVSNILVDESMNTSTTIHWHGIQQHLSNEMDGTAMVTQCPIVSGDYFEYDFTPSSQSGTYWYHSHLGLQYCEGLRGPLVIYDPQDPYLSMYDVDDETTILTLMDWYHENAYDVSPTQTADATLINGQGRYAGGLPVPLSILEVEQGKRYRIRMINMACKPNYVFSIDGHTFTVIEADGEATTPLVVDSIQILAGQRYSFILEANQTVDNYWIRAMPNYDTSYRGGQNSAILRYSGALEMEPLFRDLALRNPLKEEDLHALYNPVAPGLPELDGADVMLNLVSVYDSSLKWLINDYTYIPPPTPILMQILNGRLDASQLEPNGSVYTLPRNKTIQLTIPGGQPEGPHPFHLHGQAFSVIRSADSKKYNYMNPVRRDTTSNGGTSDNVTIRFRTDNPGPWLFHCHIDFHLLNGMAVVFATDTSDTASALTIPNSWDQLCPAYDASSSTKRSLTDAHRRHRARHQSHQLGH